MKAKLKTKIFAVLIGLAVFGAIGAVHVSSNISEARARSDRLERYADQVAASVEIRMSQIIRRLNYVPCH